jgi:hypothetical protein
MTRRPRIQPEESKINPVESKQPETKPEPETPTVADDLIGAIGAAQASPDPQLNTSDGDGAAVSPELKAELDADEAEFRALRRDLDGVKGSSAVGIVAINVDKAPPKNTFFRTHPTFNPTFSIVSIRQGMDDHFYAVTPDMVAALRAIGITASDHTLYFTVTPEGATTVVPIRQGTGDREQNEYARTKEIGLRRGRNEWVRLWTDEENHVYEVYPAPEESGRPSSSGTKKKAAKRATKRAASDRDGSAVRRDLAARLRIHQPTWRTAGRCLSDGAGAALGTDAPTLARRTRRRTALPGRP